jgi:hypothetical protein
MIDGPRELDRQSTIKSFLGLILGGTTLWSRRLKPFLIVIAGRGVQRIGVRPTVPEERRIAGPETSNADGRALVRPFRTTSTRTPLRR